MKTKTNNVMNEDLSALVAKAKTGDQAAFTELYDRTAPELYRCIRAMTRDEDLAWDIQQDSYLRAYRSLDKLEKNDAFFPWLRRIAVNVTATQMSQRKALTFTELACGEDDDATPELPDLNVENQPELSLDRKETARLVQQILSQLPEEMQLIVGMHYYDELSIKEISETLKVSAGTVKTQLFRGRKKIETAVHALEKQGVKLYGLSPVAFLVALMRRAEPAAAGAKQAAVKAAVAKLSVDAVASAAVPVAAKTFGQVLAGRLLAGALAVALIGGGIWGGAKLLKSSNTDAPYQPTTSVTDERLAGVETPEELTTANEDLPVVTEPVGTEPVVTEPTEPSAPTEPTKPTEATEPTEETVNPDWPSGSCGENLSWYFNPDTGLLTIEGSGAMDDYDNASNAKENEHITPWVQYHDAITAVRLPEGLTSIGTTAFYLCGQLTSITIPDSVTRIGERAFEVCHSLKEVSLPAHLSSIEASAFGYTGLTSLTIPDGVSSIGDLAFPNCEQLTSVTIPGSVTSIGGWAFGNCSSLRSVTIGSGVTSIGMLAFNYCPSLTSVTIPDSVTSIGERAFGYSGLEKMEGFTIIGVPGSEAERYANENGFTFIDVNTAAATELEVILARQEQDEAERSALSGTWSVAYGGDTRITEINKVGNRYQAKVVRTVAVTASEAELTQAKQTGTITLNGQEYRYTDSQEQLDEWLEGSIMQHSISVPEDGVILDASLGSAAEAFTGKGGFYEVGKVGDIYVFAYSAAGGFWQRIENTANEDLVWLDGDMPVVEGPSTGNRYTLSAYLQDHSISSGTHCSFQRDTDGEVFIYVDVR